MLLIWSRVPVMLWLLLAYEANEILDLPPALFSRALSWDGEIRTLNPRINSPLRCHCATSQLNALSSIFTQELCVIVWCKRIDSNYRSHDYQSWALTNYATFTFGRTDEFRTRDLGITYHYDFRRPCGLWSGLYLNHILRLRFLV